MKLKYPRHTAVLLLTTLFAACGTRSFDVNGKLYSTEQQQLVMTPLPYAGLFLGNRGDTVTVPVGATTFTFQKNIDYGSEFAITVLHQPDHMTCTVVPLGGSGSAGHTKEINAAVDCNLNRFSIGGSISGMTVAGLVLSNGADLLTPTVSATPTVPFTYAFAAPVKVTQAYGVVIQANPPGYQCTVSNGTGFMGDLANPADISPVTNVNVSCGRISG